MNKLLSLGEIISFDSGAMSCEDWILLAYDNMKIGYIFPVKKEVYERGKYVGCEILCHVRVDEMVNPFQQ